MNYICHRVNNQEDMISQDCEYGVEIDLRDDTNGNIYMEHEPFISGNDFEEYIKEYNKGTMILNIKSERIELKVIELLKKYNINDYFFLDSSFPMIKLLSDKGENNIALRFSEYEGIDTIINMSGKVKWIWVDCFTRLPITKEIEEKFHQMKYKICMVSPELQGQDEKLEEYANYIKKNNIKFDAICCKVYNIKRWKKILGE